MAQAAITPPLPDSQTSLSIIDPRIQEPEDPDAWEYEYSNTETETYFVTLDLTTPNFEPRRRPKIAPVRADGKGRWKNHGIASQRRDRPPSPKSYRYTEGGEDDQKTPPATVAENSQRTAEGESGRGSQGKKKALKDEDDEEENEDDPKEEECRDPDPVQILDLHSDTPMVSYRGQVFACEWASNLGTELLFTARDQEGQLPVLRSLPGEVDLLAASSCRLIPKAVTLEAKFNTRSRMATDLPARFEPESNGSRISIPVGPTASQKRKDQARFLERFISIKQERGEEDQITIIAQKRQLNNKWKLIWQRKRQAEKTRLLRFISQTASSHNSWEEVEKAKRRLQEMNDEDGVEDNQAPMTIGGYESMAYRSGRKRKAPSEALGGGAVDIRASPRADRMNIGIGTSATTPSMSTPDAQRWMDAEDEDELDGYMEKQENMEDIEYGEYDEILYEDDPRDELYE